MILIVALAGLSAATAVMAESPELLEGITNRLDPCRRLLSRPQIEALFHSHRGNIREALRQLYDLAGNTPS